MMSLIAKLENGQRLPIEACICNECKNEWFVTSISDEWKPDFCPYCGIKFGSHIVSNGSPGLDDSFDDIMYERDIAFMAANAMAEEILLRTLREKEAYEEFWEDAVRCMKIANIRMDEIEDD